MVNAANGALRTGSGVCGAIYRAGGESIFEECARLVADRGPLREGEAVISGAGRLACRRVIHAVGPVFRGGQLGEPERLASCYRESLALAEAHDLRSIAFPSIATGVFGYPVSAAARVALSTVARALASPSRVELVRFVLFSDADLETYAAELAELGRSV